MKLWRLTIALALGLVLALVVSGPAAAQTFADVPLSHPYSEAIEGMAGRGIVNGYSSLDFGPDDPVIRQQFAKMVLLTMAELDPARFTATTGDVFDFADSNLLKSQNIGLYPYHYVSKAALTGLTIGYADGTFRPFQSMSKQQVVTMAVRAGGSRLKSPPMDWRGLFSSADPTHGENIRIAEFGGLLTRLQAPSASWDGARDATRGECAQILWNLRAYLLQARTYETVDVLTAYEHLRTSPKAQLVDVREPTEWAETGVVPGALLISLGQIEGRALAELASDGPVYVLCKSGMRSRQAAEKLIQLGFAEVYNVDGGILAWLRAGLPVQPYPSEPPDGGGGDDCG